MNGRLHDIPRLVCVWLCVKCRDGVIWLVHFQINGVIFVYGNECTGIHNNQESKVQLQEIFDENTEQLKGKAEKIDNIMARLTKSGVVPKEVMQPGDMGNHLT